MVVVGDGGGDDQDGGKGRISGDVAAASSITIRASSCSVRPRRISGITRNNPIQQLICAAAAGVRTLRYLANLTSLSAAGTRVLSLSLSLSEPQ